MALHSDLLDQARELAQRDPMRPKQANLRRATSAAYYALFHFLTQKAARFLISGVGAERELLRQGVARVFNHGHMKKTSEAFAGAHQNAWRALYPGHPIPAPLRAIAGSFVDLQQARHEADYDQTRAFTRSEVQALIAQAQQAIGSWDAIANDPLADAYLIALLIAPRRT